MSLMYVQSSIMFYVWYLWIYFNSSSTFEEEACALLSQMCFSVDGCYVFLNECNATALKALSFWCCWHTLPAPATAVSHDQSVLMDSVA